MTHLATSGIDSARIDSPARRGFLGSAPDAAPAGPAITPFRAALPQAALDDLKRRLRDVRFPDKETVSDWSQGVPLAKAKAPGPGAC